MSYKFIQKADKGREGNKDANKIKGELIFT